MDQPYLTDEGLTALIEAAAQTLAARAPNLVLLIAEPLPVARIQPDAHGWAVLGRLYLTTRRQWWSILWHADEGRGRLLRYHWESPQMRSAFERLLEDR